MARYTKSQVAIGTGVIFYTNRIIVNYDIGQVRQLLILLVRLTFITVIYIYTRLPGTAPN